MEQMYLETESIQLEKTTRIHTPGLPSEEAPPCMLSYLDVSDLVKYIP